MKTELIERCAQMDQALFTRGHARYEGCVISVSDCFTGFADIAVLEEIVFETGVSRFQCYCCSTVTVVHDIECWEHE